MAVLSAFMITVFVRTGEAGDTGFENYLQYAFLHIVNPHLEFTDWFVAERPSLTDFAVSLVCLSAQASLMLASSPSAS